jgi:hypothetical protein
MMMLRATAPNSVIVIDPFQGSSRRPIKRQLLHSTQRFKIQPKVASGSEARMAKVVNLTQEKLRSERLHAALQMELRKTLFDLRAVKASAGRARSSKDFSRTRLTMR